MLLGETREANIRKPYRIRQYSMGYNAFLNLMDVFLDRSKIIRHELPADARILAVFEANNFPGFFVRMESQEFDACPEEGAFAIESHACPFRIENLA